MLRRPAPPRPAAVVVRPDDLVDEAFSAEDLVQKNLAVVGLAVVDVEVQGAVGAQQTAGVLETWPDVPQVVVEHVVVGGSAKSHSAIPATSEPDPVTVVAAHGRQLLPPLDLAAVERGIDVDQPEGAVREPGKHVRVVGVHHPAVVPRQIEGLLYSVGDVPDLGRPGVFGTDARLDRHDPLPPQRPPGGPAGNGVISTSIVHMVPRFAHCGGDTTQLSPDGFWRGTRTGGTRAGPCMREPRSELISAVTDRRATPDQPTQYQS